MLLKRKNYCFPIRINYPENTEKSFNLYFPFSLKSINKLVILRGENQYFH